jgi:hypothetical protein
MLVLQPHAQGSSVEEAQLLLDDHAIKSQAMQSSPAAAPFIERISLWVRKLASMQDILDAWITAQVAAGEPAHLFVCLLDCLLARAVSKNGPWYIDSRNSHNAALSPVNGMVKLSTIELSKR